MYDLRCGRCGEPFTHLPLCNGDLIVRVGNLLVHLEPCSLAARANL